MRPARLLLPVITVCATALVGRTADTLPEIPTSPLRSEILLNGVWQFVPGGGETAEAATVSVPSSWSAQPQSPMFGGITLPELTEATFRCEVIIPAGWQGRRVVLDITRVSTEAEVVVNGRPCGRVDWPRGEVDVTQALKPGEPATIELRVRAVPPEGETWSLMGYVNEAKTKRTLASRGLTGDVWLRSMPSGARVQDVFVKPSFRRKTLDLEVEMTGAQPGPWDFTARMLDDSGNEETVFRAEAEVPSGRDQRLMLSFPWENPRLWTPGGPELYTLVLEARPRGAGEVADAYPQRFGFREFWIEGKDFYLNGGKMRLRPRGGHGVPSHPAEMKAFIEGTRAAGFNISQIWPEDALAPGQWNFWELFAQVADESGWPLIGAAPSFKDIARTEVNGVPLWAASPESRKTWIESMRRELKRFRNHPSILMWGTTGNLNNHFADQDPAFLGQQAKLLKHPQWPKTEQVAKAALDEIRRADPTRPVFMHAASRLGDVFTVNHYLNMLPLQEREEMLSEYMKHGDVPYIGIEFGTPLNTTMNRGRAGFGPSHTSEPFATEYAAIYLGPDAYAKEPRAYRRNVRFGFTGSDWAGDWTQVQWLQSSGEPFQELQALFIRNTWRSWRASGVTGGMVPWNDTSQIFLIRDKSGASPAPPPEAGQPGPRPEKLLKMNTEFMKPEGGWIEMASAAALREVNGPALAFIAGPAGTNDDPVLFTSKAHNFDVGAAVRKSAVLINDTGAAQPYRVRWTAMLGGREVSSGSVDGQIGNAENLFLPIEFKAADPAAEDAGVAEPKVDGEIRLEAVIGELNFSDTFPFRVFAPEPQAAKTLAPVQIFDPEGRTAAMLAGLGCKTVPWDGRTSPALLVIGRGALAGGVPLPGPLAPYVRAGGRVLAFAQPPSFFQDAMGLRVAEHVSRRVFPVDASHPVLAGLDAADLRDWNSTGTLREAREGSDPRVYPTFGWRWGNRGAVSSAMLEKPHRSGWRPLLEGEFDLGYSPLLELDLGAGRAVFCTLDLEDAWKTDPAARQLARNLLAYAASAPLVPARKTVFLGNEEDFKFLARDLGLLAEHGKVLPAPRGALVVVGAGAGVTPQGLEAFAKAGGHVVVLAQKAGDAAALAGGKITTAKAFIGSRQPPAGGRAVAGLGVSDLRFRSDLDWPVFEGSTDTMADGLLHVRDFGAGRIVQTQFEPRWFETGKFPMFRLTRWRHTRALSQILANAGAEFAADQRTLEPMPKRLSLAGLWRTKMTAPLPVVSWDRSHADPGISDAAKAAVQPGVDDSSWETFGLPAWYPPFEKTSGEAVWRKTVSIPPSWNGQILQLGLGRIKAFDTVFVNGTEVGSTGPSVKDAWNQPRRYRIPASLVRGGQLEIAVRQFAPDYQGGIHGRPDEMFLRPVAASAGEQSLYHSDYREEFDFGDNPYRYYRW